MSDVRVEVDQGTCVGSRWCTTIAPQTFDIDDTGKATVTDATRSSVEDLEEAEESCPVSAIRLFLSQTITTNQE